MIIDRINPPRIMLALGLLSALLSGCNSSSSSSSGTGSSSSSIVVESFINDASTRLAAFDVEGPRDPLCSPDEASGLPLPLAYMAYRRDETPTRLVVFAHGISHEVNRSWVPHMRRELMLARFLQNNPGNVAFVSTNYRDNYGFPALRGAHDTIAATLHMLEKFPTIETVYLFGVSMGGAVSGTAIAESVDLANGGSKFTEDGSPLFDYWIDVEGVSSIIETYSEAAAAAGGTGNETAMAAQSGIERDTGGSPVQCPLAYERRSPVFQAALMKRAGIRAATVVHAVNDGLVPYNQGRQMAGALATATIPTQFYTIVGVFPGQNPGSTGTGTLGAGEADPLLNLAGHASEADAFHPVMRTAFEQLRKMLDGTYNETAPYFECVIDPNLPPDSCQVDQFQ
ncbi:alpha/beta hydrolase family protein [Litorivivens sp.]|uniref:alpha/beta hydrolase family protein n=1 Tax=Litorivivens sp. TaxID=2020868 RepID=UPI003565518D